MDFKKMRESFEKEMVDKYGWRWPVVSFWWSIEDWYYGSILYDLWWWVSDGDTQWPDAEQESCPRWICCKCGKKPF